jgi:hypothetical protein
MNGETMDTLVSLAAEMGAEELLHAVSDEIQGDAQTRVYLPKLALLDAAPGETETPVFVGGLHSATYKSLVYDADVLAVAVWEWED